MADEITIAATVTVANGGFRQTFNPGNVVIDQTTLGNLSGVVVVGTSEEDMSIGDVATLGLLCLNNLDATNYVTWGPKSSGSMVALGRIEPGEIAILRLEPGITLRWKANTASVRVQMMLLED